MYSILVMNLGSTSFKFKLFEMGDTEKCLGTGGVENIGAEGAVKVSADAGTYRGKGLFRDHVEAMQECLKRLEGLGVSVRMETLDAVGYKAVHGGSISGSRIVDEEVLSEMEKMVPFAPAHNPVYLAMMRKMRERYPNLTQIACFETAFHATIPMKRAVYGVPAEWAKEGIRRFGFHGSSHSYIAWKMARLSPESRRLISVHLGGSSSMCAILDGKSIAATMGATPQSGLFHNNRVGDFDVFCLPYLTEKYGSQEAALRQLSSQSGFLGLSGVSNDMRDVEEAAEKGNAQAQLALEAYADNITGYIGMYTAYLGGLDAICFTGGIVMNDAWLRAKVAESLSFMDVRLCAEKNVRGFEGKISADDSKVEVWSLETNEELMVARGCVSALKQ